MDNFYKISKEEADLLGKFEYEKGKGFDPYCSEQKDGTYLVSEKMYQILKEHSKFKKIDFEKIQKIKKDEIDNLKKDEDIKSDTK